MKTSLIKNGEELKQLLISLEEMILARAMECARIIFRKLLEMIDTLIRQYRPRDLKVIHKRSVWYRTRLGMIRVSRRQYQDKDGKYRYLLDELMGMDKHRHVTLGVKEIACRLAGEMPFRRSTEILSRTTPVDLSFPTIHRLVQTALADSQEENEQALTRLEEDGALPESEGRKASLLLLEADGVALSLQREARSKAEVKLGIAYEGWEKVGQDRYRTVNKTCHADIVGEERFWAGMALKLHQKYDLSDTQYIIGGDGASWIKEGVDDWGGQYQLCRFHLNRALTRALGNDKETLRAVQDHCRRGEIDPALRLLGQAAHRAPITQAKEIRQVSKYIKANADGLQDYRENLAQPDSAWRRTGAIEGNVDKLIVRRMKNQGMSWSLQGIRKMLWLRISLREGKLQERLCSHRDKNASLTLPEKMIRRVIDRTLKYDYSDYFRTTMPALSGPHSSRPWVEMLKSLTRIAV